MKSLKKKGELFIVEKDFSITTGEGVVAVFEKGDMFAYDKDSDTIVFESVDEDHGNGYSSINETSVMFNRDFFDKHAPKNSYRLVNDKSKHTVEDKLVESTDKDIDTDSQEKGDTSSENKSEDLSRLGELIFKCSCGHEEVLQKQGDDFKDFLGNALSFVLVKGGESLTLCCPNCGVEHSLYLK